MYVCICICMYVYVYVCIFMCMFLFEYLFFDTFCRDFYLFCYCCSAENLDKDVHCYFFVLYRNDK